jgi:hypothetical protein
MAVKILSTLCLLAAVAAVTDQERSERAAQQAQKQQQMVSCLTLVRSFYAKEETMIKQFVDVHPTSDKNRLTSKFLARMMLKCVRDSTPEQTAFLQAFKNTPLDLDYTKYEDLILIDWEELRYHGDYTDPEAKRPVEMSPQESMMSNDVEELSEDMRRETEVENRKSLGKTTLAFIDLEHMSATTQAFFVALAVAIFAGLGVFFYQGLFVK